MSMNIIEAESIIRAAWDQVFGRDLIADAWNSDLGLYFHVEVQLENFGYERDSTTFHEDWARSFYRSLHFVVTARHQVYLFKTEDPVSALDTPLDPAQWVNTSCHDSCWRSDGLRAIWETLREAHEFCWGHIPEAHRRSMPEANYHCSVNSGVFSRGLIQLVHVRSEADPAQTFSGSRRLTALSKASFTLSIQKSETTAEA